MGRLLCQLQCLRAKGPPVDIPANPSESRVKHPRNGPDGAVPSTSERGPPPLLPPKAKKPRAGASNQPPHRDTGLSGDTPTNPSESRVNTHATGRMAQCQALRSEALPRSSRRRRRNQGPEQATSRHTATRASPEIHQPTLQRAESNTHATGRMAQCQAPRSEARPRSSRRRRRNQGQDQATSRHTATRASPEIHQPTLQRAESTPTQQAGWRSAKHLGARPAPAPPAEGEETKGRIKQPAATPRHGPLRRYTNQPFREPSQTPKQRAGWRSAKHFGARPSPAPPAEGEETKGRIKRPAVTPRHGPLRRYTNQPFREPSQHPRNGPDGAVPSASKRGPPPLLPPKAKKPRAGASNQRPHRDTGLSTRSASAPTSPSRKPGRPAFPETPSPLPARSRSPD